MILLMIPWVGPACKERSGACDEQEFRPEGAKLIAREVTRLYNCRTNASSFLTSSSRPLTRRIASGKTPRDALSYLQANEP